ncbi:MAG: hypothetical protein RSD57_14935 [Comamonas sp.]
MSISLGATVNPAFQIYRGAPTATALASSPLPVLDVNMALVLTMRTVLGSASVPLDAELHLDAGDIIELRYAADGLTAQTIRVWGNWAIRQLR